MSLGDENTPTHAFKIARRSKTGKLPRLEPEEKEGLADRWERIGRVPMLEH